jgi:hypothetical protein
MVAPAVAAAAITSVAQLGAGLLGSDAQKDALKQQALEAARQGAISMKQLELAERMIELGLATQVDAQGNITTYDEATNTWKVIPAPKQAQLMQAADDELLRAFNYDAPMARGENLRNSARRAREGVVADGMLKRVQDASSNQVKGNDLAATLRGARAGAVNASFDSIGNDIATQSLRSGATGAGAASQLAKARAQAMAQMMGNPELEGMQLADDINASRQGNAINNYSAMATRASNAQGFSPGTSSVAPTLNAALQSARNGAQTGAQGAAVGTANAGRPIQQPGTYNPAPLIGSLGNSFADLANAVLSSRKSPGAPPGNRGGGAWDDSDPMGRGGY